MTQPNAVDAKKSFNLVAIIAIPICLLLNLLMRRVETCLEGGVLTRREGSRSVSVPLAECTWRLGSCCIGRFTVFSLKNLSIVLQTRGGGAILLGFDLAALGLWRNVIEIHHVPQTPATSWRPLLRSALLGAITGTCIGFILGIGLKSLMGVAFLPTALIFLGTLDGIYAGLWAAARRMQPERPAADPPGTTYQFISFATMGLVFGGPGGMKGMLACAILNGIVGVLIALRGRHATIEGQ